MVNVMSVASKIETAQRSIHTGGAAAQSQPVALQVCQSLEAAGSQQYAVSLAAELNRRLYTPVVCSMNEGGPLEAELLAREIPFTVMNSPAGLRPEALWHLFKLFRRTRAEVVHTHHFRQLLHSIVPAKLVGARLVHTEHTSLNHPLDDYGKLRCRIALRLLSRMCDAVVAVGTDGAQFLRDEIGIPGDKVYVVPGGINIEQYCESRQDCRLALGFQTTDRIIVTVARLYPQKNHRLLLAAFDILHRKSENAKLLIVGGGPEEGVVRAEIDRLGLGLSVSMLGIRRDIPRILAASDLFLMSSDFEGVPISVLEAMAACLPVVSTNVGDLPMVVRDGVNGRLVPPGNPEALAAAALEVLSEPGVAARMGAAGRRHVENFTARAMAEKYEQLYSLGAKCATERDK